MTDSLAVGSTHFNHHDADGCSRSPDLVHGKIVLVYIDNLYIVTYERKFGCSAMLAACGYHKYSG